MKELKKKDITISNEKDIVKRKEQSNFNLVEKEYLTITITKKGYNTNISINLSDVGENPFISQDYTSQKLNKIFRYRAYIQDVLQLLDIEEKKINGGSLK